MTMGKPSRDIYGWAEAAKHPSPARWGGLQIPLPPDLRPHREKRDKMGVPELTLPSLGCLHPALGNGKRRDRQ